jgi:hypothetical protein
MSAMKGICPKCGTRYCGWALTNPRERICKQCGSGLEIYRDGLWLGTAYSPFNAPQYKVKSSDFRDLIIYAR